MTTRLVIFFILLIINACLIIIKSDFFKNKSFLKNHIFSIVMFLLAVFALFINSPYEIISIVSIIFLIDLDELVSKFKN